MKGEKINKICKSCDKEFRDYISNKRGNFCSLPCYWKARKDNPKYAGYWTGKKRLGMRGCKSSSWKGENIGYHQLHVWVKKHRIKEGICELCNKLKKTDWANKSHQYKRDLDDWLELCRKCHIKFDEAFKGVAKEKYGKL